MTRIVINPSSVRATARTLRDAGHESQSVGRALGREPIPAMPSFMRARTAATLRNAEREATLVADELFRDAHGLDVRAERIEKDIDARSPFAGVLRSLGWLRDRALENGPLRFLLGVGGALQAYRDLFARFADRYGAYRKVRTITSTVSRMKGMVRGALGIGKSFGFSAVGMLLSYDDMRRGLRDYYSEQPYSSPQAQKLESTADRWRIAGGLAGLYGGALQLVGLGLVATGVAAPAGAALYAMGAGLTLASMAFQAKALLVEYDAKRYENEQRAWKATRDAFWTPAAATPRR